jgi:hypothetical protein
MPIKLFALRIAVLVLLTVAWPASSSEIGLTIANQVSQTSFQNYLDNSLYTHNGHNRDALYGAQHNPARTNIQNTFQSFGLSTQLEAFSYSGTKYNVVATQPGTAYASRHYIIGAHYDSAGNPGADDDASGVAAVLEIARIMSAYRPEYTIKYIAFDAEEYGLIGSKAYVNSHPNDDILGMISLDMIAYDTGGDDCVIYGRSTSVSIKYALANAIDLYGNGLSVSVLGALDASDHAPFEGEGIQACLLIEADDNPNYHTSTDSVDTANYIDYAYAVKMTRSVAGWLADRAHPHAPDCNSNGIDDTCDTSCSHPGCSGVPGCGQSADYNANWFPDECEGGDLAPPTDLQWVQQPTTISTTAITMSAFAQDPSGVEYNFIATGAGSQSSGWQTSQVYTNSNLQINRNYTYQAKARDQSPQHNETLTGTTTVTLATFIETPTALTVGAVTETSIQVTAPGTFTRLASAQSGLYFEVLDPGDNPVGGSNANAWVKTQTITATGLTSGVTYRFRVKARNYYGENETAWYPASGYTSQATQGASCTLLGDMNGDGLVNGSDVGGFVRTKLGGTLLPGENAACANYGGTLEQDIADFVGDLLGAA